MNFAGYVKSARRADRKVIMELTLKTLNGLKGFTFLENRALSCTISNNQSPCLLYLTGWADMAGADDIEDIGQRLVLKIAL